MFLKSLEIRGFKSFADKTELRFTKGITAIVGPNGSGKSNVSDAVRWVLGEQSAKTLRGSKMEDIIFTGTEYRKAIGIASVSLTLDNSDESLPIDFNEVKVTRRIYRSGESEYLINNSTCRLKDIVNLFMDTGIGKEGYSLIGQGKIDAILSGKSDDRRALLEEAAGIVKYKSRKSEAERKLKNTADNLTRINDIVYTYEERLEPLEEEKKKAEKYLTLASELKEKDINLLVNNLISINSKIEVKEDEIKKIEEINILEKEKNNNARESLKKLKVDIEKLEVDNLTKKEDYLSKKESIVNAKSEILLLQERIKNFEGTIKKSNDDIDFNLKKKNNLNKELMIIIEEFDNQEKGIQFIKKELSEKEILKSEIISTLHNKEVEINKLKNKDIEATRTESNYFNRKAILESKFSDLTENLDANHIKISGMEASLNVSIITKFNLDNEILEEENKKTFLISGKVEKENDITTKKTKLIDFEKGITRELSNISRLSANRDMLSKLEKEYEGYNVSVKKLMTHISKGFFDVKKEDSIILGELIDTKKGFETAIEISLAGAISNIVTKDEHIAKQMIEYLKKNKLGRATFLPLSIIKGKKIIVDSNIKQSKGYLGVAAELVKFDAKYERIINHILGRTLICENIDCALDIAKKSNYRYKIVTLFGEIINSGGALTGGSSYQKNMGIISRKKESESLLEELSIAKENLNNLNSKQEIETSTFELSLKDLKILENDIHKKELDIINIKSEVKRLLDEMFNLKTGIKNITSEVESIKSKCVNITTELEELTGEYSKVKDVGSNNKVIIDKLLIEVEELIAKKEDKEKETTSLKVKFASVKENADGKSKNILRMKNEVIDIEIFIEKINKINEETQLDIKKNTDRVIAKKSFINFEEEKLLGLEEKSKEFEAYRAKIKEKINKLEGIIEELTLIIAKKEEELHRHKIIYTKHESDKNNSSQKLFDEYDIDSKEVLGEFKEIEDIEKHKASIYLLKSKINSLGSVNVNAVEEFKELLEKYKFLTRERDDLENARKELIGIIEDMTSKMKVIFRQNFNILNKNFDSTFKELFKGGSATLILDDLDELNSDIEIRVQPPGKKIQNINLMSGGEKVLSAIALLFAILRMKPTPFCILDEIEAALDDANVSRYAEFLKQFADNIQFIVITHRKGTMEVSDIMYGVTMEEKGISKIVSVDLNKK
ncbi:chromosome segregation protein SMC [uncultured Clostridium sp.]|jgi:chromosome segregation protein|uniref:chromosome segregation protein SMC n=1 Tax=uncultured Clostridium sp. TaxID=59620 RepID=UPI00261C2398|nr:chromosome segregation protein SMC [uncultured Clostridium sp.]